MRILLKIVGYLLVFVGNLFLTLVTLVPTFAIIGYPEAEPPDRFYGYGYFGIYAAFVGGWLLVPYLRKLPYTQVTYIAVGACMTIASIIVLRVNEGAQMATESLMIPFLLFFTPTPYILLMMIGFVLHGLRE